MMEGGELKALIYDNVSGAREIAERGLALLQRAATVSTATEPAPLLDELADLAVKVVRSKPEMPQVFQGFNRFLLAAEAREAQGGELGPFRIGVLALLQEQIDALRTNLDRIAEHAEPLIANGAVVVTHSRSSTVLAALRRAKRAGRLFDVVVAESRPNLEGRTLARELSEDQIPVRLVVDALLATAVEGADRVLVGADALTSRSIVNKVGTKLLALAARETQVPVTVLAESTKAWVKRLDPVLGLLTSRPREPKEVWEGAPYGIEVVNLYFEPVPVDLVTEVVDEDGVHQAAGHWDHVRSRGYARRLADAFGDELA
jgi:translation initiation factor 2B subunit (eIF-2B alpha/beta/delta family)